MRWAFIGAGAMGGALAERLVKSGTERPEEIMACDPREERLEELSRTLGVRTSTDNREGAEFGEVVVLAVPPGKTVEVLREVRDLLGPQKVLISVAAGVTLERLESGAPERTPILRPMPNIPSMVGRGANAVCWGKAVGSELKARMGEALSVFGTLFDAEERELEVCAALCAVGVTFFLPLLDALAGSAERAGLDRKLALRAVSETMAGTAVMVLETGREPEDLKGLVGLRTLDEDRAREVFRAAFEEAVRKLTSLRRKLSEREG